jgi:hypothetical protein
LLFLFGAFTVYSGADLREHLNRSIFARCFYVDDFTGDRPDVAFAAEVQQVDEIVRSVGIWDDACYDFIADFQFIDRLAFYR